MNSWDDLLAALPDLRAAALAIRDPLLSDVIALVETPAPTGHEEARADRLAARLTEAGADVGGVDEQRNVVAVLPGIEGARTLLVAAPLDALDIPDAQREVQLGRDELIGPFVGDNAIALAAMAALPTLLDRAQIRLRSNLLLIAAAGSLGRGNFAGLRHALASSRWTPALGWCLESVQLGRLNYAATGLVRGEIRCALPPDYDWAQYGASGTILPMADIIERMGRIPLSQRPLSTLVLGSIRGGISHSNIARETTLCFEARSESADELRRIRSAIEDIVEDAAARSGQQVSLDVAAWRDPGALDIGHPLVRRGRAILQALGISPMLYPTTSQLGALLDRGVPGITLGLTSGRRRSDLDEVDEAVSISALATGLTQLVAHLVAADLELTP